MESENFSQQESFRLINEMISKAKKSYVTKGIAAIVWGTLIIICSMFTWAQIEFGFRLPFDIWLLTLVAVVTQIIFGIREKRTKDFTGHNETTANYVWSAFGVCIFLLSFMCAKLNYHDNAGLFMLLYGVPTFITGGMSRFKPMIIGGIICWILAVISVYTSTATDMLLMAFSGLFAWLIPGIILWIKYKKQVRTDV